MSQSGYVLGHSDDELRRLELQSRELKPLTMRLLDSVGLTEGMSVLDVGTGAGDVALLAASRVGTRGRVVGIDRSVAALERARARALEAGLDQVRFEAADFGPGTDLGRYDLVVGRYVLVHQRDPAAHLRQAARHVRGGGALAVIESAQARADRVSVPPVASYDQLMDGLCTAFAAAGADPDVGSGLVSLFQQAGLPAPSLTLEIPAGDGRSPMPEWMARTAQSVGMVESWRGLADRLRDDAVAIDAQLYGPRSIAGWVRVAG